MGSLQVNPSPLASYSPSQPAGHIVTNLPDQHVLLSRPTILYLNSDAPEQRLLASSSFGLKAAETFVTEDLERQK